LQITTFGKFTERKKAGNFADQRHKSSFKTQSSLEDMSALRAFPSSNVLRPRHHSLLLTQAICIRRIHFAIAPPTAPLSFHQFLPTLRLTLPASMTSLIPIVTGIWDSILRAVPKKKSSYSQKRKRQLAGKGLKDKTNLTRCEACGDSKLLHTLCASCVKSIQRDWRERDQLRQP
jgi:large subunit ribosomal protein L32